MLKSSGRYHSNNFGFRVQIILYFHMLISSITSLTVVRNWEWMKLQFLNHRAKVLTFKRLSWVGHYEPQLIVNNGLLRVNGRQAGRPGCGWGLMQLCTSLKSPPSKLPTQSSFFCFIHGFLELWIMPVLLFYTSPTNQSGLARL